MKRVSRVISKFVKNRLVYTLAATGYFIAILGGATVVTNKSVSAGSVISVSSQSNSLDTTQSLTINIPTGVISGDVLVASIFVNDQDDAITATGWTSIISTTSTNREVESFYKVATGSEPSNYTFSISGGVNRNMAGGITNYRGVNNSTPIDTSGGGNNGSSTSVQALSTPTTVTDTAKVISVHGSVSNSTFTPPSTSGSPTSTYTARERYDATSTSVSITAADYIVPTNGSSFGTQTAVSSASGDWVAHQVALRPDSQVHMLLFWDGTGDPPTGWSYVDDANGKYIRGDDPNLYGAVGGSTSHTLTASSITVGAASPVPASSGGDTPTISPGTHTHPNVTANSFGSGTNTPAYRTLRLIMFNTGITNTIPAGAIAPFDNSPGIPASGWTRLSDADGRFIRIDSTIANGGVDTHTHTLDLNDVGAASAAVNRAAQGGGQVAAVTPTHTHVINDAGFTTATNNTDPCDVAPVAESCFPPYVETLLAKANTDTPTITVGISSMFDGDPGGGWVIRSQSGGTFYQRFMRGSATYDEACGDGGGNGCGDPVHTHSNAVITSNGATGTGSNTKGVGTNDVVEPAHTHTVTAQFNTASNIPEYFNIVLGEKVNLILSDYVWYVDNDALTPTDRWGNPDLGEHVAITVLPIPSAQPPNLGQELRLRVKILVNGNNLNAGAITLKLQFNATNSSLCTAATGTWTDVGTSADTTKAWRYATSNVTDGATLWAGTNNSVFSVQSNVAQNYIKSFTYGTNPNSAAIGQYMEFDFHIQNYSAPGATQYSFRVLENNGTLMSQYDFCPTLTTMPRTENQLRHGNFFKTNPSGDGSGSLEGGFSWVD